MRHILFELPTPWFTIPIMGYGLMIVLGFAFSTALALWRAKRCGENPEHIMNLALLALVGGIGGARLLYVLGNMSEFAGRGFGGGLLAVVNVRAGGLVYYGGLILATALALIYIYRKKLSTRRMLDILAPSLMLGLAFGRAGCFLNGCCWGGRCTMFEDVQAERAALIRDCEPAAEPSAMEKLIAGSLLEFPYASPAYEQQAHDLPWAIRNNEGQITGYAVPSEALSSDGSLRTVHSAPLTDKAPSGPCVDVPLSLLTPRISPLTVSFNSWQVVDAKSKTVGYYHRIESKKLGGAIFRFSHEPPVPRPKDSDEEVTLSTVAVPENAIYRDQLQQPKVQFTFLGRDELNSPADRAAAGAVHSLPVYPAQLYGIFNALLLCAVLSVFFRRRWREGQVFAMMVVLYPISRFLLEAVRKDTDLTPLGMTFSQTISLLVFIGGVLLWVGLYHLPAVAKVALSGKMPGATSES